MTLMLKFLGVSAFLIVYVLLMVCIGTAITYRDPVATLLGAVATFAVAYGSWHVWRA